MTNWARRANWASRAKWAVLICVVCSKRFDEVQAGSARLDGVGAVDEVGAEHHLVRLRPRGGRKPVEGRRGGLGRRQACATGRESMRRMSLSPSTSGMERESRGVRRLADSTHRKTRAAAPLNGTYFGSFYK